MNEEEVPEEEQENAMSTCCFCLNKRYIQGSRKRIEIIKMSDLNSHSHGEQSLSYPHDTHDETNFCDGVNLPQKLLNLQLLCTRTNEGNSISASGILLSLISVHRKYRILSDTLPITYQSGLKQSTLQAQVQEAAKREEEDFWTNVKHKTQQMQIGRTDAILEMYTDRIIEKKQNNIDEALLWVTKNAISELSAELFVTRMLRHEADACTDTRHEATSPTTDDEKNTSLHYAAQKGWTSIAKKLMKHHSISTATNKEELTPLELAIHNDHNECATFLVKSMEPERVRSLFQGDMDRECKLKFCELLEKSQMQTTVLAVLDTMIQPHEGKPGTYTVYYDILDGDWHGRPPNCDNFNSSEKSCLYEIAKNNSKEVVYHDVVRLLLMHKWIQYGRVRFLTQLIFYIIQTVIMTSAFVLAAKKANPRDYDKSIDIFRIICEALLMLCIIYNVGVELYQCKRNKSKYFKDYFNYLDIGAVIFPLLIIPFRVTDSSVQWIFASLGYLCQTMRGLEFAAFSRSTGAYVQILFRIFMRDMVPFFAVFSLFLFAFTGAFYFALHGEEFTTTVVTGSNCTSELDDESCVQNITTVESSSLDTYSHLTKEYYHVLFSNLRVMIHGGNIFDEYYGPNGFKWFSVIIYIIFLFLVIIVLLNLLIAQMSDTYTNVQLDAQQSLFINLAWIVARIEQSSLFAAALINYRKRKYKSHDIIHNPHELLNKWESPPISQVSKEIYKMHKSIKQQETANAQLMKQVNKEIHKLQSTMEEKETTHARYRDEMIRILNEQNQLIHKLTCMFENKSEAS